VKSDRGRPEHPDSDGGVTALLIEAFGGLDEEIGLTLITPRCQSSRVEVGNFHPDCSDALEVGNHYVRLRGYASLHGGYGLVSQLR
jgi:hypothetical protein